eukprot:scaffold7340_cov266-Pinguiococcus_pyrenoidosus.AAC.37
MPEKPQGLDVPGNAPSRPASPTTFQLRPYVGEESTLCSRPVPKPLQLRRGADHLLTPSLPPATSFPGQVTSNTALNHRCAVKGSRCLMPPPLLAKSFQLDHRAVNAEQTSNLLRCLLLAMKEPSEPLEGRRERRSGMLGQLEREGPRPGVERKEAKPLHDSVALLAVRRQAPLAKLEGRAAQSKEFLESPCADVLPQELGAPRLLCKVRQLRADRWVPVVPREHRLELPDDDVVVSLDIGAGPDPRPPGSLDVRRAFLLLLEKVAVPGAQRLEQSARLSVANVSLQRLLQELYRLGIFADSGAASRHLQKRGPLQLTRGCSVGLRALEKVERHRRLSVRLGPFHAKCLPRLWVLQPFRRRRRRRPPSSPKRLEDRVIPGFCLTSRSRASFLLADCGVQKCESLSAR